MDQLPTEAEVAEMRKRIVYPEIYRSKGDIERDRLIALIDVWAPIVKDAAYECPEYHNVWNQEAYDEWKRWTGGTQEWPD